MGMGVRSVIALAIWLLIQKFIYVKKKETIKVLDYWLFVHVKLSNADLTCIFL